jgi:hypothetical protein
MTTAAPIQTYFTVTLPTVDNTGAALTAGQITQLVFQIGGTPYTYAVPAGTALGASLTVPFASLTPVFAPVGGTSYTADVEAVDAGGTGLPSSNVSWTQNSAVPAAPTGFGVA